MRTLESSKLFPTVAWTTVVLFSVFTMRLAMDLQEFTENLEQRLESQSATLYDS